MPKANDPILNSIVRELKNKYRCHTIVLYGSRARGLTTVTSDYDVIGVRRAGEKTRIAKEQKGYFWDVFVYPEKDLRKLNDQHVSWKNARIIYGDGPYGRGLLRRIKQLLQKPYQPQPQYEIDAVKIWAKKQLARCEVGDIQGLYRRAEFQAALINDYFMVRKKRFLGPKAGFSWIEEKDPQTFRLIRRTLKSPSNLSFLKAAASRVYKISIDWPITWKDNNGVSVRGNREKDLIIEYGFIHIDMAKWVVEFEWDASKETINIRKHRVTFAESIESFFDPKGFQMIDKKHSKEEQRYYWIGKSARGRVLTTWFTRRSIVIRIIGCAEWRQFRRLYNETTENE